MNTSENNTPIHRTERFQWQCAETPFELDDYLSGRMDSLYYDLTRETPLLNNIPSPFLMKGLKEASKRVVDALQSLETIAIFGDYDVDGTTACAMLSEFFEILGHQVIIYIPDRLVEGYGLNVTGVEKLKAQGVSLIITVDNGIAACAGCEKARALGIDVVVTDHHDVPSELPRAFAILNPKQDDCDFPYPMISGVGVAFYFLMGVRAELRSRNLFCDVNLKQFLDFVAIGTVADMVPLHHVNHIFCRVGLDILTQNVRNKKRPGLYHLLNFAKFDFQKSVAAEDVGFKIGPRLNAAGRLGNALRSVQLLTAKEDDVAQEHAKFLHEENTSRQELEKKMIAQAIEQAEEQIKSGSQKHALVLFHQDWHPGVVGLVASRLLSKYYRPTIVFGWVNDQWKGSGRSTHSFHLFQALDAVREKFVHFGGHKHAIGCTLPAENCAWLVSYLNEVAAKEILESDKIPPLLIAGQMNAQQLDLNFISKLEQVEPFGIENPRPRWLLRGLQIRHIKRIGKDLSLGHARVLFRQKKKEFWITVFSLADKFELFMGSGVDVDIVVEAKRSLWNNRNHVEFSLIDFTPVLVIANHPSVSH